MSNNLHDYLSNNPNKNKGLKDMSSALSKNNIDENLFNQYF